MGHEINRVGWGGWFMKSTGGGVGHAGMGWVMQRWRGASHMGWGGSCSKTI